MYKQKIKNIIEKFIEKGVLISPELLQKINEGEIPEDVEELFKIDDLSVADEEILKIINEQKHDKINWAELEKAKALFQKNKNPEIYKNFMNCIQDDESIIKIHEKNMDENPDVKIVFSYDKKSEERTVAHFVSLFNQRYKKMRSILQNREEMKNLTAINRIKQMEEKQNISTIAIIKEISLTENKNYIVTLEDPTGEIKAIITTKREILAKKAQYLVDDEVIGITGQTGKNIIFVSDILFPEIPNTTGMKKSPVEEYAVFISDIHIGNKLFMKDDFQKFINWLNKKSGSNEQKALIDKIKYLFIAGDLVEGIGIYPNQESDLNIFDIREQYRVLTDFLLQIPPHINIIVCGGNHDAMRLAEPQPKIYYDFAKELYKMPNVIVVSNPSLVNIGRKKGFEGFNVLMYHGFSFFYYADKVIPIRENGWIRNSVDLMKLLLQKRHLAPSHTSTLYIPDKETDPLIIEKIPDFFVTGHIHRTSVSNYKNITLINASCWTGKTKYQEKAGLEPEPARAIITNLKSRQTKILKF